MCPRAVGVGMARAFEPVREERSDSRERPQATLRARAIPNLEFNRRSWVGFGRWSNYGPNPAPDRKERRCVGS